MEVLELLEIVNRGLEEGKSVTGIGKEIGLNESSIRKKLTKNGYKRIGNKFILQAPGEPGGQPGVQSVAHKEKPVKKAIVGQEWDNVGQNQKKLIDIVKNYETIMEIIEHYKGNNNAVIGGIEIRLPNEENKSYKASLRINETVLKEFKEFCSNHKTFSQKELLSMALVEYMEKYK